MLIHKIVNVANLSQKWNRFLHSLVDGYKEKSKWLVGGKYGRIKGEQQRRCETDMKIRECFGKSQHVVTPEVCVGLGQVGTAR